MPSPDDTTLDVSLTHDRQVVLTMRRHHNNQDAQIILSPVLALELARRIMHMLDGNNSLRIKMN